MAVVVFDSSALVRRYIRTEPGAARVRSVCSRAGGNQLVIVRLTPIELASAFNRRLREGSITEPQRDQLWRLFLDHMRRQYRVQPIGDSVLLQAERLLFRHPLRAYDAVQLAGALSVARLLDGITSDVRFCTADRGQAGAAQGEGLTVELIS